MTLKRAAYAFAVFVIAFLMMPTAIIAIMSFGQDEYLRFPPRGFTLDWYRLYLTDPDWQAATLLSLKVAALTAVFATIIGTAAAVALIRGRPAGQGALRLALLAPTIMPNIVTAIAIYYLFSKLHITGTITGFVTAHTILATPLAFLCVAVQLQNFDMDLEIAALSLGAPRMRAFREVTLPLIRPAVIVGAIFAFLVSFDEAVVSFFISGPQDKTLPRKMFEDIDFNVSPTLAAVATVVTLVTLALLAGVGLIRLRARKGRGQAR